MLKLGLGFASNNQTRLTSYDKMQGHFLRLDALNPSSYTLTSNNLNTWIDDVSGIAFSPGANMALEPDGLGDGYPAFDFQTNNGGIRNTNINSVFSDLEEMSVFVVLECGLDIFVPPATINSFGHLMTLGSQSSGALLLGSFLTQVGDESFGIAHWQSTQQMGTGLSGYRYRANLNDKLIIGFRTSGAGSSVWRNGYNIPIGHRSIDYFTQADADTDFSPSALGVSAGWCGFGIFVTSDAGGLSRQARGKWSEINMYDRALSDAEMISVMQQLGNKWGIETRNNVDAFILAGQSNASGLGTAPVEYANVVSGSEIMSDGYLLEDLVTTSAEGNNPSTQHGIEIPALRYYKTNYSDNVFLKHALSSTSLAVNWKPTAPYGSSLETALAEWDNALNAQLVGNDRSPNVKAFFWIQGETDASSLSHANAYEINLGALVDIIHGRYGSSIPFIIAKLNPNLNSGSYPYVTNIRIAQDNVASNKDNVFTVETDGLTTSDGLHYDSVSLQFLGALMVDAALQRQNKSV